MAEITAGLVKELREMTGLGMMECKKVLSETAGDLQKAEELLRIKSGAKASKAAARIAAEGVVGAYLSPDARLGALVEVNCETDFVAKNEDFLAFAEGLAKLVAEANPADVDALASLELDGAKVEERRQSLVQKIGENIAIRRFACYQTDGRIAIYLHGTRIGVMVDYSGGDEQLGKDLAMHIAAANPLYLSRETVPADVLARERAVYEAQARESGKPAAVIGKIVDGKLEKFYSDSCLLEQVYIKDPDGKLKIRELLKKDGGNVVIDRFVRYQLGEGIEKKKENFAEEVAAQLK